MSVLHQLESINQISTMLNIRDAECDRQKILVRAVNSRWGVHREQVGLSSASQVVSGGVRRWTAASN